MIDKILSCLNTARTLTEISDHVTGNRDIGTLVGRLLRDGLIERIETRRRNGPITFKYRKAQNAIHNQN